MKNYYVFEYFKDSSGDHTTMEGEIQGFTEAEDPWTACTNIGIDMDDVGDKFFAKEMQELDSFVDAIAKERKHLSKISKQLKEMTGKRDEERDDFKKNRPCPNCGEKLDENYNCDGCGFGHEAEQNLQAMMDAIKEEIGSGKPSQEQQENLDELQAALDELKGD